jgi:hypothetical protein
MSMSAEPVKRMEASVSDFEGRITAANSKIAIAMMIRARDKFEKITAARNTATREDRPRDKSERVALH